LLGCGPAGLTEGCRSYEGEDDSNTVSLESFASSSGITSGIFDIGRPLAQYRNDGDIQALHEATESSDLRDFYLRIFLNK